MMNTDHIIHTLSDVEQQQFILYLEKKNKRSDTKNIDLFKLISKQEFTSSEICSKLYDTNSTNAYHALCKRLNQSLIDFTANRSIEEENSLDIQIIKYILASRTFLIRKQYKVAYKILDKAEVMAQEHLLFPLLNEIYHTKIQYSYTNQSEDIDELIRKFKANQKHVFLEDELNIVYAKIRQVLDQFTYHGDIVDFETLLTNTLKEHNITITDSMSFKSLYQLMTIVSISAFVTKDYLRIEPFLIDVYKSLQEHKEKEKQLFYHIQVLYLIAYTLFRNKKFEESLFYLNRMHGQMQLKRKKYYNTFHLKHKFLLALNYNYSKNPQNAIAILEDVIIKKHPDIEALLYIYLSLVMCYFQQGELKKAQSIFSRFNHRDKWYEEKAGKEWLIKKNLIEILLYLELGHIDLMESRLLSFKRNYYQYLKSLQQDRVITYLSLVELYYKNPERVTSMEFFNLVKTSFEWVGAKREDIFVMSFYAWLKSKMEQKPLYEVTMGLIEKSQNVN
jgi:hypothetical protein